MTDDQKVTLNREEAELVDAALGDYLDSLTGSPSEVAAERARGFRLQVKLSKILPNAAMTNYLPDWALSILHRTFAPDQAAPAKKPPKGKATGAGAVSSAGTKKPSPSTPATARGAASTVGKS